MTNLYTAEEKVRLALEWVARQEPWVIPVVLTRWAVTAEANSSTCPTMQTNGRVMNYNPAFVDRLSLSAVKCIVLHETAHVLNFHCHRRGNRNPQGWNIAADLAINCQLIAGYRAAYNRDVRQFEQELVHSKDTGGCFVGHGAFKDLQHNLSAEEYYDLLKSRNPQPEGEGEGQVEDADDDGGNVDDEEFEMPAMLLLVLILMLTQNDDGLVDGVVGVGTETGC